MTLVKRTKLRMALRRLHAEQVTGTREKHALAFALSNQNAFDNVVERWFTRVAIERGTNPADDPTFWSKLAAFVKEWGPTILKICITIAFAMLGAEAFSKLDG
tara:strand:+ start:978 stop:1286 length:309 start_codon:yes stop_codon:yes gene_type:complete